MSLVELAILWEGRIKRLAFSLILTFENVADADARSQRKEKTPVDAESSDGEDGDDRSDTDLSTVTNLSETRRQIDDELGDAALNSGGADKGNEGNTTIKFIYLGPQHFELPGSGSTIKTKGKKRIRIGNTQ